MRHPTQEFFAAGLLDAAVLSLAGCGSVDQAVCDDVKILEAQYATVEGELQPEVAREVRDDYAEIATSANFPGYDAED
jgi:hypothetical protein